MTTYYIAVTGYPGGASGNTGTNPAAPKTFDYGGTLGAGNQHPLTDWLNTLTNGDTVRFYPGNYFGAGYFQQVINKQLTLKADSYGPDDLSQDWFGDGLPVASRFTRNVEWHGFFQTSANITTDGIHNRPMVWPSDWRSTGDTWAAHSTPFGFVEVALGAKWTRIKCEASLGYGPEGFAPFDTSRMYEEYKSPVRWQAQAGGNGVIEEIGSGGFAGHGNLAPFTTNYNTIANAPRAFNTSGSGGGSFVCTDEYIHDVNYGAVCASLSTGKTFEMTRVWSERFYADAFQTANGDYTWDQIWLHGCVFGECFGDPYDGNNPHSDIHQNFTTSSTLSRILNIRMTNCIAFDPQGARSSAQFGFHQGSATGRNVPTIGSLVSRCLVVGPQKLMFMSKSNSALLEKSIGVVPSDMIGPFPPPPGVTASYFTGQTGSSGIDGSSYTEVIVGSSAQVRTASCLVRDTILEKIDFQGKLTRENALLVGHGGSIVPLTTVFGSKCTNPRTTPASVFDAFSPVGIYADKGPGYATVREMLEAPRSLNGQAAFVGIGDSTLAATNQTIESLPFYVHGGNDGDLLPITVPAGVQWRILDKDVTTALTAYSGSAGNVQAGRYVQLKRTSASGASTKQSASINIGGNSFVWNVTTKSNNDLPAFSKPATAYLATADTKFQRNGANYAADTKEGIMWIDFMVPSTHGLTNGTYSFIVGLSGRTFRCDLAIGTGSYHFTLAFYTSAAAIVGSAQILNLPYDKRIRFGISVDTSQPDLAGRVWSEGYNVTDNVILTPGTFSPNQNSLIGVTANHTANSIKIGNAVPATIYGFYCEFERSFQQLGITPRSGWNYTTDDLGPAGEGIMANPLHNWTGPHSTSRTYQTNDGVTYNGKSYVSLIDDNLNNLPTGSETDNAFWKHVRRRPAIFIVGKSTASPFNLGTGNTFTLQGTGSLTDVNGQAHPPALTLLAEVLDSAPYNTSNEINILVTPSGFPKDVTLTPSSNGGGTWTTGSTTLMPLGSTGITLTFNPSALANHTISVTNDSSYTNPANLSLAIGTILSLVVSPGGGRGGLSYPVNLRIKPS